MYTIFENLELPKFTPFKRQKVADAEESEDIETVTKQPELIEMTEMLKKPSIKVVVKKPKDEQINSGEVRIEE